MTKLEPSPPGNSGQLLSDGVVTRSLLAISSLYQKQALRIEWIAATANLLSATCFQAQRLNLLETGEDFNSHQSPRIRRASEIITELSLAIDSKLKLSDLAATIHPYPAYCTGIQLLARNGSGASA